MNLNKLLLTKNDCYKAGAALSPKGVMVHSTGANNPTLRRYVGPDDGVLGVNPNNNHWNQPKPDGISKCVHAFIGLDKSGVVRTYQTLPWDMRGWHGGGSVNNTHIGFEICEDALSDKAYFDMVYREAVELTAYICDAYKLDPAKDGVVIDHSEGYRRGIASNHGDVKHWFTKHGKSMDTFRADVKAEMARKESGEDTYVVEKRVVCVNGKDVEMNVIMNDGRTFVELRSFEKAGYEIDYNSAQKKAVMGFVPQMRAADVNGVEKALEMVLVDGSNYVKLRELGKLGIEVEYDEVRRVPVLRS